MKNLFQALSDVLSAPVGQSTPLWQNKPTVNRPFNLIGKENDEKHYQYQCDKLASFLLLKDDNPTETVHIYQTTGRLTLRTLDRGELIAGSYIAKEMFSGPDWAVNDVDIYLKSEQDAGDFLRLNGFPCDLSVVKNEVCTYVQHNDIKLNLIWGIEYSTPEDLISRFDIRACSVAFDPNTGLLYAVRGAIDDCLQKKIVFNPIPRHTSVRRLVKYTQKGFAIDKYQRLFFAELIRSEIYSQELELSTGY